MFQFSVVQLLYLGIILYFTSWTVLSIVSLSGLIGVLLETSTIWSIMGFEEKLENGRYERVRPIILGMQIVVGRIVLYELTRHSDHHYTASKKYQVLDHHEEAQNCRLDIQL